ncbi:MAG: BlaI/MecI/CopY family transcriptional regulator [Chloroflexi bacterium]|nr:BlaI/MecI/CopY family transcriptional regulator [Chloroflexota bacterium]
MGRQNRVSQQPDRSTMEKLLGDLELAIMEIAWETDQVTVRDVLERLNSQRHLAYTTVMTVMNRLVEKELLTRILSQRTGVYRVAQTREAFLKNQAAQLVRSLLDDFGEVAVAQFIEALDQSQPERLQALERFVARRQAEGDDAS